MSSYSDSQKWFIGRIEYYLQSAENELQIEKQIFNAFRNDLLTSFRNNIDYILTILGIISTLIAAFFGIAYQQGNTDLKQYIFSIAVITSISATFFIAWIFVIIIIRKKVSKNLNKIDEAYLETLSTLCFFKGFFIRKTTDKNLSERQLKILNDFIAC